MRSRFLVAPLLALAGVGLAGCHGGAHLDFAVTTTADGADAVPGDGICEMTAGGGDCSLRAAIDEVNAHPADVVAHVTVPAGTYVLSGPGGEDGNTGGDLDVARNVTVSGTGPGATVIDGSGADRVFDVLPGGSLTGEGLTVQGGDADGDGGGARADGQIVFLSSTFTGNVASGAGGAVWSGPGVTTVLLNSTVSSNSAATGGGLSTQGPTVLRSVTVTAQVGGGVVAAAGGSLDLTSSLIGDQVDGPDCAGAVLSSSYTIDSDGSCATGGAGDGTASLLLGPLTDNGGATPTQRPLLGSPAVNRVPAGTGGCDVHLPSDQRGSPRPADGFCDAGAVETQPGELVVVSTVLSGLNKPWDIAFAPDGTMLFTEKAGSISAMIAGAEQVMHIPPDVVSVGEGGMLGLTVDPEFSTNRYLYACYLANNAGIDDVRVVRWQVSPDYSALSDATPMVTGLPVNASGQRGRHSGCRPRFGPDGVLWITTGDAATASVPQDPTSLGGKVLRVDRDGNPAPGNPGPPLAPQVFTFGHRNPQGIDFRPGSGIAYAVEHGTNCDDEVNVLEAGRNYGWNPNRGDGVYRTVPMTDLVRHPDAKVALWSSGCPTIAPSGGSFVSGAAWGALDGAFVLAVLKDHHLRFLLLDAAGTAVTSEHVLVTEHGRLRVAVLGPDGALYVARDEAAGSILRVAPAP